MEMTVRHLFLLDVVHLHLVRHRDARLVGVLQNLDVLIQDVHLTSVDARRDEVVVALVGAELRHLQRMDCCLHAEGVA